MNNNKKKRKKIFISTPIFYPNEKLHLGHAYTMVIADIIARYKRSKNYQVFFQTGSDEHGEKIEKKALSLNISPKKLVDDNVILFKELLKKMNISNDIFYRTSSSLHIKKVKKIFKELLKNNDIYLDDYKGNYCITCEDYIINNDITNKKCIFCDSTTKEIKEKAYFLSIKKNYHFLIKYYKKKNFILPNNIKKELENKFLKKNIRDLCITRKGLKWGISVPNNNEMTIYVWFDALLNYLNSKEGEKFFFPNYNEKNSEIIHIIGKDISRFHCIYWPIILKMLKGKIPNNFICHGWIMNKESKMSKSKGNCIDPLDLIKSFSEDVLRAYFVKKIIFLNDGFLEKKMLEDFYRDFFVNKLSNLVSRVCKMITIYNNGNIPIFNLIEMKKNEKLEKFYQECFLLLNNFQNNMKEYNLTKAFLNIEDLIKKSNVLIQDFLPWELKKNKEEKTLNLLLNCLANGIKIIAFLLNSFTPNTSYLILKIFKKKYDDLNWKNIFFFNELNNIKIPIFKKHLYE